VPAAGAGTPDGPTAAERLQLAAVHELATGAGVLVAVIDTGIAPHPRLAGRLRGGGDYLAGGDGLDDCDGHGTAVAGLLAAAPSADDEVVGMAPGAALLAIRQSSPSHAVPAPGGGVRPAGDVASLAEAVVLAVGAGADVVNVSEAVCLDPEQAAREGAGLQAALRRAAEADVVVVAAAGNAGVGRCAEHDGSGAWTGQVALPGWYDDIVTVGATGPDDRPAPFTVAGPWVDLAAPGTGLRSLAVGGGVTADPVAGTSFSARGSRGWPRCCASASRSCRPRRSWRA
jgi:membrane-anchored mycosin MYCP